MKYQIEVICGLEHFRTTPTILEKREDRTRENSKHTHIGHLVSIGVLTDEGRRVVVPGPPVEAVSL